MSLVNFPQFKKFDINEDAIEYLAFFNQLKSPYSDLSINNILIWLDFYNDLEVSVLDNVAILRFSNVFDHAVRTYCLVGNGDVAHGARALFEYQKQHNEPQILSMLPQETALQLQQVVDLTLEDDNADYVLHVPTALSMEGKKYENFRARIRSFEKQYGPGTVTSLDLTDSKVRDHTQAVIEVFMKEVAHNNDIEGRELVAIKKHLELAKHLAPQGYMVSVGDEPVSIGIFHYPPHKQWCIFNHLKSNYAFKGIAGYSFYQMIQIANRHHIEWLNYEQDLGIPGLRQLKQLLRPHHLLDRYSALPRKNQ